MASTVTPKIEEFFSHFRLRSYKKGQVLLLNGDNVSYVYHLEEGRVKQYDVTYRGDEVILNIFKPPSFFPMSNAINGGENPFIYEADTDIQVRLAPVKDVVEFVKSNPDVLLDLLSRVYRGTDGLLGRMTHLMASSAKSRLMYELLIEARRFGKLSGKSCSVKINEKDLGARAGLSRETVSREISKLKNEGLITLSRGGVVVPDMAKFEERVGHEI